MSDIKAYAVTNEDGSIRYVTEQDAPPVEPHVELANWSGSLPPRPAEDYVLRLVDGELTWHDPLGAAEREARQAAEVRAQRDARLAETDWRVARAAEHGQQLDLAWRQYRQALRDMPQQPGFPATVQWPALPTSSGSSGSEP